MPSFKSIAAGFVALLAADTVLAGPCRPSSTTTGITAQSSSASTDSTSVTVEASTTETISSTVVTSSETTISSETSVSGTETASSSETASSTLTSSSIPSTTETTTAVETTSTTSAIESTSTTSEAPATLPTIANAGFDGNSNGEPWTRSGPAGVSNGAVYWKLSEPNVMVLRPGTSVTQQINGLRTNLSYRIRFNWVKFDTPSATGGCVLSASFGGEGLGDVVLLPPRTPDNVFEEYISTVYQPSTTSADLKISMTCSTPGQSNRFVVENVSIEFA